MRDLVADPKFQLRKKIEATVQRNNPELWTPLYTQVKFTNIPYHDALMEGQRHDVIMEEVLAMPGIENNWDSDEVEQMILKAL